MCCQTSQVCIVMKVGAIDMPQLKDNPHFLTDSDANHNIPWHPLVLYHKHECDPFPHHECNRFSITWSDNK